MWTLIWPALTEQNYKHKTAQLFGQISAQSRVCHILFSNSSILLQLNWQHAHHNFQWYQFHHFHCSKGSFEFHRWVCKRLNRNTLWVQQQTTTHFAKTQWNGSLATDLSFYDLCFGRGLAMCSFVCSWVSTIKTLLAILVQISTLRLISHTAMEMKKCNQ